MYYVFIAAGKDKKPRVTGFILSFFFNVDCHFVLDIMRWRLSIQLIKILRKK